MGPQIRKKKPKYYACVLNGRLKHWTMFVCVLNDEKQRDEDDNLDGSLVFKN